MTSVSRKGAKARRKRSSSLDTPLGAKARAFGNMSSAEQAAAVMHLIYHATIARDDVDWQTNLPENWVDLDDRARTFNLRILDTWADNPKLFELWVAAVRDLIRAREPGKGARQKPT